MRETVGIVPTLDDEEFEIAWTELDLKRKEWLDAGVTVTHDCCIDIRGGIWTREHAECGYDYARARARGQAAESWCKKFRLQLSMDIKISDIPDEIAQVLLEAWCRRYQFYYDYYRENPHEGLCTQMAWSRRRRPKNILIPFALSRRA